LAFIARKGIKRWENIPVVVQLPHCRLLKKVIISVLQWAVLQLERWECLLAACYISILPAAGFMGMILKDTSFQREGERERERERERQCVCLYASVRVSDTKQIFL